MDIWGLSNRTNRYGGGGALDTAGEPAGMVVVTDGVGGIAFEDFNIDEALNDMRDQIASLSSGISAQESVKTSSTQNLNATHDTFNQQLIMSLSYSSLPFVQGDIKVDSASVSGGYIYFDNVIIGNSTDSAHDKRILLKDQTEKSQNGIWIITDLVYNPGGGGDPMTCDITFSRADDFDNVPAGEVKSSLLYQVEGGTNAYHYYITNITLPFIIELTPVNFTHFGSSGNMSAYYTQTQTNELLNNKSNVDDPTFTTKITTPAITLNGTDLNTRLTNDFHSHVTSDGITDGVQTHQVFMLPRNTTALTTNNSLYVDSTDGYKLKFRTNSGTTNTLASTGELSNYSTTSHNHDSTYLKLLGGNLTGVLSGTTINATTLQEAGENISSKYAVTGHNHDTTYLAKSGGTLTGLLTGTTINATTLQEAGENISSKYALTGHNHDGTYLAKSGGTLTDLLTGTTINATTNLQEAGTNLTSKYAKIADPTFTTKITTPAIVLNNTSNIVNGSTGDIVLQRGGASKMSVTSAGIKMETGTTLTYNTSVLLDSSQNLTVAGDVTSANLTASKCITQAVDSSTGVALMYNAVPKLTIGSTSATFAQPIAMGSNNITTTGTVSTANLTASGTLTLQGKGVSLAGTTSGQVLGYNGSSWAPATSTDATRVLKTGDTMTGGLTVPSITLGTTDLAQILGGKAASDHQHALSALSDVAAPLNPTNGQVLSYDGTTAKWKSVAMPLTSGGTITGDLSVTGTVTAPTIRTTNSYIQSLSLGNGSHYDYGTHLTFAYQTGINMNIAGKILITGLRASTGSGISYFCEIDLAWSCVGLSYKTTPNILSIREDTNSNEGRIITTKVYFDYNNQVLVIRTRRANTYYAGFQYQLVGSFSTTNLPTLANVEWVGDATPAGYTQLSAPMQTLSDLSDVATLTPSNGHILTYDSSITQWKSAPNLAITTEGGSITGNLTVGGALEAPWITMNNHTNYCIGLQSAALVDSGHHLTFSFPQTGIMRIAGKILITGYRDYWNSVGAAAYFCEIDLAWVCISVTTAKTTPKIISFTEEFCASDSTNVKTKIYFNYDSQILAIRTERANSHGLTMNYQLIGNFPLATLPILTMVSWPTIPAGYSIVRSSRGIDKGSYSPSIVPLAGIVDTNPFAGSGIYTRMGNVIDLSVTFVKTIQPSLVTQGLMTPYPIIQFTIPLPVGWYCASTNIPCQVSFCKHDAVSEAQPFLACVAMAESNVSTIKITAYMSNAPQMIVKASVSLRYLWNPQDGEQG